ncbi:MAG: hypothetical protein KC445_15465 [Anaerolineales bacterium]|nr:hypothetical protein [Anaerolineales bacterium]MCB8929276.1 hypothetical protein [Ardenticatenaceae bacterium]
MNEKRDAYVHTRVTERELRIIDTLARHLRRSRSDTMRVIALEKAEELGLVPRPPRPKPTVKKIEEEKSWNARDCF